MNKISITIVSLLFIVVSAGSFVFGGRQQKGYIIEHEQDLAKEQPAPHNGSGMSTAFSFFANAPNLKLTFRKRSLKKGAEIGYHLQNEDEIYYIISGSGVMKMNDESFVVKAGDAILTRPGNSHGLKQTGEDNLVVIINYLAK